MDAHAAIELLKAGKIGVLPTDTIYGLVAPALDARAVERLYQVRKRRPDKPCIILIADAGDLSRFGVAVDQLTEGLLNRLWPGAVSVVLGCENSELSYLHRGTKTLAFRLPDNELLRNMLRNTGPLIAPSANPEGLKPATTIAEAKVYFEDAVDFYVPASKEPLIGAASTVVEIQNGKVVILRQGVSQISQDLL